METLYCFYFGCSKIVCGGERYCEEHRIEMNPSIENLKQKLFFPKIDPPMNASIQSTITSFFPNTDTPMVQITKHLSMDKSSCNVIGCHKKGYTWDGFCFLHKQNNSEDIILEHDIEMACKISMMENLKPCEDKSSSSSSYSSSSSSSSSSFSSSSSSSSTVSIHPPGRNISFPLTFILQDNDEKKKILKRRMVELFEKDVSIQLCFLVFNKLNYDQGDPMSHYKQVLLEWDKEKQIPKFSQVSTYKNMTFVDENTVTMDFFYKNQSSLRWNNSLQVYETDADYWCLVDCPFSTSNSLVNQSNQETNPTTNDIPDSTGIGYWESQLEIKGQKSNVILLDETTDHKSENEQDVWNLDSNLKEKIIEIMNGDLKNLSIRIIKRKLMSEFGSELINEKGDQIKKFIKKCIAR